MKDFLIHLFRQKYLWTIVAFIVYVGFIDPNSFWRRYELHQQNNELREEIKRFEEKYEADTKEYNELKFSPEAVERVARVNLYMKTEDEDVYIITN